MLPLVLIGVGLLALLGARARALPEEFLPVRASRRRIFDVLDRLALSRPTLPRWFIYAMAEKESGFGSRAYHGRNEDSLGIFQVNWNAHGEELSRRGVSRGRLYDPEVNAAYWGELAETLRQAAIARGYRPPGLWYAVRLRLKGIRWEDFGGRLAQETIAAFRPVLERWEGRMA